MIHVVRESEGDPAGTLVLLHGRGADEHDLLGLLDELDPQRRLRGITIGGPLRLPPGGRHWYVVERIGYPQRETFLPTFETLSEFLDEELALDWSTTVIGGFSQGGVMAYAIALGRGRPAPAGVIGLSCFVPTVGGWTPDPAGRRSTHVAHHHGIGDRVIDVSFARQARAMFDGAGLPLLYREFAGGHHVDAALLPELRDWVAARVP